MLTSLVFVPGRYVVDTKHISCAFLLATLGCAHSEARTVDPASTIAVKNEALTSERGVPGQPAMTTEQASEEKALNSDEPLATDTDSADEPSKAECERAVFFATGSADLVPEARRQLSRVAACLKRHDVDYALVVGAADVKGSSKLNEKLALDRAQAVAEYLRTLGVPEDEIRVRARDEMASAEARQLWPLERQATVSVPLKEEERARKPE
jgi:outer membrane protein OmpA-like peptidoglycan-associated protein